MKQKELTFTCGLGVFTFDSNVNLSHAKLLRDTVQGAYFNPPTGMKRLRTEEDIYQYARDLPMLLSFIPFEVEISRGV